MKRRTRPEQLDIPLVWEHDDGVEAPVSPRPPQAPRLQGGPHACSALRLALAAVADLGLLLIAVAGANVIAVATGAALLPVQIAVSALAGVEAFSLLAVTALWGWAATPGMMLLGAAFSIRLPLGRAAACWGVWFLALPSAGFGVLVGQAGRRPLERLAGGAILSCRQPPPSSA